MTLVRTLVAAAAAFSIAADCSAQTLRILAPPEGASEPSSLGISKNGQHIAGWALGPHGIAVLWGPSRRPVVLPTAGESDRANSVSDDGHVVVGVSDGRATIWTPQGVLFLGQGEAYDVDARGEVVVARVGSTSYAYHISTGTFVELLVYTRVNAVNSDGTLAVGEGGIVWSTADGEVVTVLRSGLDLVATTGISDDGRIVGGDVEVHGGYWGAGRWVDGVFSECWVDGCCSPGVYDLSADGNALVGYSIDDEWGAIMWDTSHGVRILQELFRSTGQAYHYHVRMARGISGDANRVVGEGFTIEEMPIPIAWEVVLCPADFNADSVVDFFDYLDYVEAFADEQPAADLTTDGQVDFFDYLDFVQAFDAWCE
jgi:uncharacterized membrane protein